MLWYCRKAENPFWSQPITERPLVTPANREPEYHPVCKALLCVSSIWNRSLDALLWNSENRQDTAGSMHAKLASLSKPANSCLASLLCTFSYLLFCSRKQALPTLQPLDLTNSTKCPFFILFMSYVCIIKSAAGF